MKCKITLLNAVECVAPVTELVVCGGARSCSDANCKSVRHVKHFRIKQQVCDAPFLEFGA